MNLRIFFDCPLCWPVSVYAWSVCNMNVILVRIMQQVQQNKNLSLEDYFLSVRSPALTQYRLEVCHAMLLPASATSFHDVLGEQAYKIQTGIMRANGVRVFLNILVSDAVSKFDSVSGYLVLGMSDSQSRYCQFGNPLPPHPSK